MIHAMLEYLMRMSWIWLALLAFYYLFFYSNHNWLLKRRYLIAAYLLGLIIPLVPAFSFQGKPVLSNLASPFLVVEADPSSDVVLLPAITPEIGTWDIAILFWIVYIVISSVLALRLLLNYTSLWKWIKEGEILQFRNTQSVSHPKIKVPFTGLGLIFLPQEMHPRAQEMACEHEYLHLQSGHHLERLPMLLGRLLCWFHPLQWLFQHQLEAVQEYEVDEGVLQKFPLEQYGKLLVQASMAPMAWRLNFFSSPLKNRINMMRTEKRKGAWRWAHSLSLSLLLAFLVINCSDAVEDINVLPDQSNPNEVQASGLSPDFFKEVAKNIKYPDRSRKQGVVDVFRVNFDVQEDGSISDIMANTVESNEVNKDNLIVVVGYTEDESIKTKTISEFSEQEGRGDGGLFLDVDEEGNTKIPQSYLTWFELSVGVRDGVRDAIKALKEAQGQDAFTSGKKELFIEFKLK